VPGSASSPGFRSGSGVVLMEASQVVGRHGHSRPIGGRAALPWRTRRYASVNGLKVSEDHPLSISKSHFYSRLPLWLIHINFFFSSLQALCLALCMISQVIDFS
jgi:hypothetical protein